MLGISRHDHVTNESVYSQTQSPTSVIWDERTAAPLPWPLTSPRQGGSYQQIRLVCTICRETKCWRAETFVFAIHLKSHYGRLQSTEGERNTTPYRRPGLLETSGCRLPGQFGLNCRRDETRRDWSAGAASTANLTNHNRSFTVIGRAFMRLICLSLWRKHWPFCSFWRI